MLLYNRIRKMMIYYSDQWPCNGVDEGTSKSLLSADGLECACLSRDEEKRPSQWTLNFNRCI